MEREGVEEMEGAMGGSAVCRVCRRVQGQKHV